MKYTYGKLDYNSILTERNWEFASEGGTRKLYYSEYEYQECLSELGQEGWRFIQAIGTREFILEKTQ